MSFLNALFAIHYQGNYNVISATLYFIIGVWQRYYHIYLRWVLLLQHMCCYQSNCSVLNWC